MAAQATGLIGGLDFAFAVRLGDCGPASSRSSNENDPVPSSRRLVRPLNRAHLMLRDHSRNTIMETKHRFQKKVEKTSHKVQEVGLKVFHAAEEAAQKLVNGAKEVAGKARHRGEELTETGGNKKVDPQDGSPKGG
jgi:hypothetical protein